MRWEVDTSFIESWLLALDHKTVVLIAAALEKLAETGPNLGRPLVDTLEGSKFSNMKELRPGSSGRTEIRIIFAFDPERTAITLLGGDKQRQWSKWYKKAIPVADSLYEDHLKALKEKDEADG